MLDHLPPAPADLQYIHRKIKNSQYTTTGLFEKGAALTKNNCKAAPVFFFDFDLVDWMSYETETPREATKRAILASDNATLSKTMAPFIDAALSALREIVGQDPTTIVNSGHGIHAYYWLIDPPSVDAVQAAQKQIVTTINKSAGFDFADPKVINPGERLSRPPGSINPKGAQPRRVVLLHRDPSALLPFPDAPAKDNNTTATITDWDAITLQNPPGVSLADFSRDLAPDQKKRCQCPFHNGNTPDNAFVRLDSRGVPFLRCTSENTTYRPNLWAPHADPDVAASLTNNKGKPVPSLRNTKRIMDADPLFPRIFWDLRLREIHTPGAPAGGPFRSPGALEDISALRIKSWIAHRYNVEIRKETIWEALQIVADNNPRNLLTEYLDAAGDAPPGDDSLLDDWLIVAAGAEDTPLNRAYSRRFMISAVARAYMPGSRVDTVLTLTGRQGAGKSSLFQSLTPRGFFADSHLDLANKDSYQQLARAWLYEISELGSFTKRQHETIKAWVSSRYDNYREPYGRTTITRPRQTVLVATTNDATPLTDGTGSRRFWVVAVDPWIDTEWVKENAATLWGAAVRAFRNGDQWWLTKEEEAQRETAAGAYETEHPLTAPTRKALGVLPPVFSVADVLDRMGAKPTERQRLQRGIVAALSEIGAARLKRTRWNGIRGRYWIAPGEVVPDGLQYENAEEKAKHKKTRIYRLDQAVGE